MCGGLQLRKNQWGQIDKTCAEYKRNLPSLSVSGVLSTLTGSLRYRTCDHRKIPGSFFSLQSTLAEISVPHLVVDVFLDIPMAGLIQDKGDLVVTPSP
jgi:hypothetical protein